MKFCELCNKKFGFFSKPYTYTMVAEGRYRVSRTMSVCKSCYERLQSKKSLP